MTRENAGSRPFYRSAIDGLMLLAAFALIVFVLYLAGYFAPVQGRYVAIDGDSLRDDAGDIRLFGIDAPELHQTCADAAGLSYPCGRDARDALRRLTQGFEVQCVVRDQDRYGRRVGQCRAAGVDVNAGMVRQGWAIAYRRHSLDYVTAEAEARKAKAGIWQGRFEPPEQWRAAHETALRRGELGD